MSSGKTNYIHGTDASEQDRLAALNRLTNTSFIEFLDIKSGMHVLEVGSGLGVLAKEVAASANDVRVVGVEISAEQIAAAVKARNVHFVQGDAARLEFEDECFDLVYARFVLEHVTDPEGVLTEMRRVTKQGGRVALCDNDISLVRLDPPCETFDHVWGKFGERQRDLGGDALIGRKLHRLLHGAGFSKIELSLQPEVHCHGSSGFQAWLDNLKGIVHGAAAGMIESGLCTSAEVKKATAELDRLSTSGNASALFAWNRALAMR